MSGSLEALGEDDDFSPEAIIERKIKHVFDLKKEGGNLFAQQQYGEAIEVWRQSVKESLKLSVQHPSREIYDNQWICRLNMAMAYMKLEEWVEAKDQLVFVLEQKPYHVKALLRLASVYETIQDTKACLDVLKKLEDLLPVYDTQEEIITAGFTRDEVHAVILQIRSRLALRVEHAQRQSKKLYAHLGKNLSQFDFAKGRKPPEEYEVDIPVEEMASRMADISFSSIIRWDNANKQSAEDSTKLESTKSETFIDEKADKQDSVRDPTASSDDTSACQGDGDSASKLPFALPLSTLFAIDQVFGDIEGDCQVDQAERERVRTQLGYLLVHSQTLHVYLVGARGDMVSPWTSFLERVPSLKRLVIYFIGFTDKDSDLWSTPLKEGVLSPALTNKMPNSGQKLIGFIFKGTYQLFLEKTKGQKLFPPHLFVIPEPPQHFEVDPWMKTLYLLSRSLHVRLV